MRVCTASVRCTACTRRPTGGCSLAITSDREWRAFVSAIGDIDRDAGALAAMFRTRSAAEWERVLTAADFACVEVEVVKGPSHAVLMEDEGLGRPPRHRRRPAARPIR